MTIVLNGTTGITTPGLDAAAGNSDLTTLSVAGNKISAVNSLGFRNRIINGDCRIDQRNAGVPVTTSSTSVYPVDRFVIRTDTANGTAQRSTTAPTGFVNSLIFTAGTGTSPSAAQPNTFSQRIEGFNVSDLGWGSASAQTVTLSFMARASVTGTYAVRLGNGTISYVATYTINAANTWEAKTITVAGPTTGTWATDNSVGIYLNWDLGSGSNFNTTAGSWQTGDFLRTSGSVSLVATTGATFYITGVQLEAGSVASPFERVNYTGQLAMCQRYCFVHSAANGAGVFSILNVGVNISTTSPYINYVLPVTMRSAPTFTWNGSFQDGLSGATGTSIISSANGNSPTQVVLIGTYSSGSGTTGYANLIRANNSTTFSAIFSSEL